MSRPLTHPAFLSASLPLYSLSLSLRSSASRLLFPSLLYSLVDGECSNPSVASICQLMTTKQKERKSARVAAGSKNLNDIIKTFLHIAYRCSPRCRIFIAIFDPALYCLACPRVLVPFDPTLANLHGVFLPLSLRRRLGYDTKRSRPWPAGNDS